MAHAGRSSVRRGQWVLEVVPQLFSVLPDVRGRVSLQMKLIAHGRHVLVDALVSRGSPAEIATALLAHLEAGGDQVAVQSLQRLFRYGCD